MKYVDVHAHFDDDWFGIEADKEIENCHSLGVDYIINASCNIETSYKAIEFAKKYSYVYCTIGIHPQFVDEISMLSELERIYEANPEKIVAIGEIGLDYHYDGIDKLKQKELFILQLKLAKKLNLPVQIHSRDAVQDMLEILNMQDIWPEKVMFHCYELNEEITKIIIDRGYSISLGGNITYKRKQSAIDQIKSIPISQIMLETDSPYLAPEPLRGTRNSSANIPLVCKKLTEIKGLSEEVVASITMHNFVRFYNINK